MDSKKKARWPPSRYCTLCFEVASRTSIPASSISRSKRSASNGIEGATFLTTSSMRKAPCGPTAALRALPPHGRAQGRDHTPRWREAAMPEPAPAAFPQRRRGTTASSSRSPGCYLRLFFLCVTVRSSSVLLYNPITRRRRSRRPPSKRRESHDRRAQFPRGLLAQGRRRGQIPGASARGLKLRPYPAYVNLMAGNLDREFGPDHNVAGPVTIFVPPEISGPLGAGVGRALQAQGIKVVLSILSHTVEAVASNGIHHKYSVGWSTMTAKDN